MSAVNANPGPILPGPVVTEPTPKPSSDARRVWVTPAQWPTLLFAGASTEPGSHPSAGDILNNLERAMRSIPVWFIRCSALR